MNHALKRDKSYRTSIIAVNEIMALITNWVIVFIIISAFVCRNMSCAILTHLLHSEGLAVCVYSFVLRASHLRQTCAMQN